MKEKRFTWPVLAAAVIFALIFGVLAGGAVLGSSTPKSCLAALDAGDAAFELAGDGFRASADVMAAAETGFQAILDRRLGVMEAQIPKLEAAGERMAALNGKLDPALANYRADRDKCRAEAR